MSIATDEQIEFTKKALFGVCSEINEDTRLTKNNKSLAVAIVLNKLAEIEKLRSNS